MKLTIGVTTFEEDIFLEELLYCLSRNLMIDNLKNKCEVIIVNDNGNNTRTHEILEAYQEEFRIIKLEKNYNSPSHSRNVIIDEAQGEYILFFDGDDNITTSINEIITELENKVTSSDVYVSEVQKIVNEGQVVSASFIYTKELFSMSEEEFEKNYYKYVIHQTGIWSIYKVAMLREKGYYYSEEMRYEDNLFLSKLVIDDEVKFGRLSAKYYGWRTNFKSFSRTNHELIIESRIYLYEKVLKLIEANPRSEKSPYLLYSVWNQTYGNLIRDYPKDFRKKENKFYLSLLKKTSESYRNIIKKCLKNTDDAILNVYKFKNYNLLYKTPYLLIVFLKNLKKVYGARRGVLTKLFLKVVKLLPLNKKKIFFTSQYGQYNDNPKYLYLQIKENPEYKNYRFVFAVKDKSLLSGEDFIDYNNRLKYYYHFYTSQIIYFNTWLSPLLTKKKKQKWIQTWHGYPYKKIYKDIPIFYETTPEHKIIAKAKAISRWDQVWSLDTKNKEIFERLFPSVEVVNHSYSKIDWVVKNANNEELKERIRQKYDLEDQKYILFAPTYRPYFYQINFAEIKKLVPQGFTLLCHLHPLFKGNDLMNRSDIKVLKNIEDIQNIVLLSDKLITDYSSLRYDFEQLNREVIIYDDDRELYGKIQGLYN